MCVCVCMCVHVSVCVCMCMCVYVYASVVFKNGEDSFTQCIVVHIHKVCEPASWHILCELTIVWAKRN